MMKLIAVLSILCSSVSARATEVEPADTVTLGIRSNLAMDAGLMFEVRVNERFAWNLSVGLSIIQSELGGDLGVGLKYFVAEDFRGFYIGFMGQPTTVDQPSVSGPEFLSATCAPKELHAPPHSLRDISGPPGPPAVVDRL